MEKEREKVCMRKSLCRGSIVNKRVFNDSGIPCNEITYEHRPNFIFRFSYVLEIVLRLR